MVRTLAIGLAAAIAACALQANSPPAEAAGKKQPQSTNVQKGDDKGVAWISGAGGVRGSGKAKGKKAK